MKPLMKQLAVLAAIVGSVWGATAWPRINNVETGRTPEYPELRPHDYSAGEQKVTQAVERVIARLPRWVLVGSGKGPGGSEIQAVHTTRLGFKDDVSIRIRRQGERTGVSVRSRSRLGAWDFGQNARNIRELLGELDREVF